MKKQYSLFDITRESDSIEFPVYKKKVEPFQSWFKKLSLKEQQEFIYMFGENENSNMQTNEINN